MNKILAFIGEVRGELSKVVWPSKDELIGATIVVCFLTIVLALILGSMDFVFSYLMKRIIF